MDYFDQQSDRLTYRKLNEKDIDSWVEYFVDNDRLAYLGLDLSKTKETLAEEWIRLQFNRYQEQGLGHLAIELKETGEFIGMGGIIPRELNGKKEYEIAYSLIPRFWGNGFATEIARTFRDHGFKNKIADRFISIIDIANHQSAHVARKNGMLVLFKTEYLGLQVNIFGVDKTVNAKEES
ncbi:Protein N-acetyltransferase, RimJ/RimL family [Salinimicrobium sediminis]|uniref:Protein N-acetyltransferase, RimJ/RimL family n=1 Tax=Salinimicrobium sediminis TaxID=1343891 RepID=A0A285X2U7_9FLAO|nr:GNAT family N-acetyltransferase [Salinimicrobium sediminis]SOC79681.1 Protein N-acetyltransferase, RimJ/RimL family [Salinimicrobium sediminis]